eukprot:Em0006g3a
MMPSVPSWVDVYYPCGRVIWSLGQRSGASFFTARIIPCHKDQLPQVQGLRIQHFIDAAEVPLSCSILQSLKGVVNILAAGRAPPMIASFLAGGNLTALVKSKQGSSLDIRPIAVGEALRRLTGKCLCALVRSKASEFFQPHQFGVACPMGAEKIVHGLRACVEKHWLEENLVVLKVDMKNAFNLVSRQALLSECAKHFPELYPWAHWCYSQHPYLWHTMGNLTSECGVQQGDPLGPLLFSLVLNILVSEIVFEPGCANLLYHAWYLDDGVVAGSSTEIEEVGALDPQVALMLLRTCSGFCKLSHLARATPPSLSVKALELFDQDVRSCLSQSTSVDLTDVSWNQAQLSLSRGGLGMLSLMLHAPAAYIASVCSSGYGLQSLTHLTHAVEMFNVCVAPADKISLDSLASSNINQKMLSSKLDDYQLQGIFNRSSVADRARLLSISAPHSSSWLSVVPSEGLGLHFEPNQYNVALKWWLGLDTSCGSCCAFCPDSILDPLGHHASTCKRGGDAVLRHNLLRDVFADSCRLAQLPVKLEVGNNLTPDHDHSRPADVLVHNWSLGKPAAFDFCVTSPLNSLILSEAGVSSGVAAKASEIRKHNSNDAKCVELGWVCIPLVVETYGAWGQEAVKTFVQLASRLAIACSKPKSVIINEIYGRLNTCLMRSISSAILTRIVPS